MFLKETKYSSISLNSITCLKYFWFEYFAMMVYEVQLKNIEGRFDMIWAPQLNPNFWKKYGGKKALCFCFWMAKKQGKI